MENVENNQPTIMEGVGARGKYCIFESLFRGREGSEFELVNSNVAGMLESPSPDFTMACLMPFVASCHCLVYNGVLSTPLHPQTAFLGARGVSRDCFTI